MPLPPAFAGSRKSERIGLLSKDIYMRNNFVPELMTMKLFCELFSCGKTSAYREIAAGRLRIRKFGTATRIARADAEAWAKSLPTVSGEAA